MMKQTMIAAALAAVGLAAWARPLEAQQATTCRASSPSA